VAGDLRSWALGVDGDTATDLAVAVLDELSALRGTGGDRDLPRLTNGDCLALLGTLRDAASRAGAPAPWWPEGHYAALGYETEGDKFRLDRDWIDAPAADELQEATVNALSSTASDLDARGVPDALELRLDTRPARIRHLANVAWDQLQRDRRGMPRPQPLPVPSLPVAPGLPTPPVTVPIPAPVLPQLPGAGGVGVLLIIFAAAYLLSRK
jgi:hypothetical protein